MGRYAQAQRRGGHGGGVGPLAPPPPPTLAIIEGAVAQIANSVDNAGGTVVLYQAEYELGPYLFKEAREWASVVTWGLVEQYEGTWLLAAEIGNGIRYAGTSLDSNRLLASV